MSISFCRKPARAGLAITVAFALSMGAVLASTTPARGTAVAADKRTGRPPWARRPLPAGGALIAIDRPTRQLAWPYPVTAAVLPLRPVVAKGMVYLSSGREESPVCLKLEDGLPNTGESTLPPDVARAIARSRK